MLTSHCSLKCTCAWLFSHAIQQPDAVAITNGQTSASYHELACSVVWVMDRLAAANIRSGFVLGVEIENRFLHMLVLLACEALGITTISLQPFEIAPPMNLGRLCDRILASTPVSGFDSAKTLVIKPGEWMVRKSLRIGDHRLEALKREPDFSALVRLIKSSGTTGVPKVMGMTHQVWQRSIQTDLGFMLAKAGPHPRFLCLYHFSVRGCHRRVWVTLRLGGTVHLGTSDAAWNVIDSGVVDYAMFITGDLEKLVRSIPSGTRPSGFHIDVIGSPVSTWLREESLRTLAETILVTYSSNETAHVSVVDENNVGTLFPNVEIKICDVNGNPVPFGQTGLIRIKCDTMTPGYVDAPSLSEKTFIDGWFHTNDLGYQPSLKELVVLGRADDVLNVGGLKISPSKIEDEIRAIDGILDAIVVQDVNALKIGVLVVAIEIGRDGRREGLASQISPIIQRFSSTYDLMPLSCFPRTETGKVRREAIREAYRQQIQGKPIKPAMA